MLSQGIFFLLERIRDLLSLEIELEYFTKHGIEKLEQELSRIHEYLRDDEGRKEEQLEKRFYLEISSIVDSGEDILNGLTSDRNQTNPMTYEIENLIKRIEEFYQAMCMEPSYNINTGNSINIGGQQSTGSISVYIGPNEPPLIRQVPRKKSYGHVQNCDVVGFHKETETLLNHLIQHDQTRVVGIVGMGGTGKTTLARHLYQHPDIKKHFAVKVWVCISQSWNKRNILYEISRQTKGATCTMEEIKNWSDEEIAENLYVFLGSKLYLVILDDIWGVDAWNDISPALPASKGSKVVVTTRDKVVPEFVDPSVFVLEPKPLNEKESYELFCKRTFADGKPLSVCQKLGEEMVKKCRGLPLAITALAGALRVNKAPTHWMRISKNLTQNIMNLEDSTTQGVVKEVLALSYQDLPDGLKHCFLYLCIFPEDYEIHAGMLMKLWIAECLITHYPWPEEDTMLVAEEYLEKLTQRYIIQDVKRNYMGRVKTFQIHDLIREMCIEKAKAKGFIKDSHRLALSFTSVSLSQSQQQCRERLESVVRPAKNSRLRSLIFIHSIYEECLEVNMQLVCEKFKLLRVLILWGIGTYDHRLPEGIGNLIHLRYLGLRASDIETLPECIGNLHNLLTLDFRCFYADGGPPENLWRLKCLRHLYLPVDYLEEEPDKWKALKLDKLENLQTLWYVRGGDWMLSEMAGLSPTLQKLCIVKIQSDDQLKAVFRCPSVMLDNLQTVKLDWSSHNAELHNTETFKNCKNLYKLFLRGKIRESKSTALVFPPNLIKLEIQEAELEATELMAVLGNALHHLKILTLGRDAYMGTELTCNSNSFPELEELKFEELPNLKLWTVKKGAMQNLKELTFISCPKLYRFPEGWRFVSELQQVNSCYMSARFEVSLQLWREQYADLPNSLPRSSQAELSCLCERHITEGPEAPCSNKEESSVSEVMNSSSGICQASSEAAQHGPGVNKKTIMLRLQELSRCMILPVYMAWMIFFVAIFAAFIGIWKAQNAVSLLN